MSRRGARATQPAPSWADVDAFLEMASKALRVRAQAAQELEAKLTATSLRLEQEIREKGQVARQEASAAEDSSFLASQVQALMAEKQALAGRLQAAERERDHLLGEVALLRGLLEGHTEESPHEPAGTVLLREELAWERQRSAELEDEAAALGARVAALERASQAQHAALLTCMQEAQGPELELEQHHKAAAGCGGHAQGLGSTLYSGLFE